MVKKSALRFITSTTPICWTVLRMIVFLGWQQIPTSGSAYCRSLIQFTSSMSCGFPPIVTLLFCVDRGVSIFVTDSITCRCSRVSRERSSRPCPRRVAVEAVQRETWAWDSDKIEKSWTAPAGTDPRTYLVWAFQGSTPLLLGSSRRSSWYSTWKV